MVDIAKSFDSVADDYDAWVKRLCPRYDEGQEVLVDALPKKARFVLELGVGTGTLTEKVLKKYERAMVTCVDLSQQMLLKAKEKLVFYNEQINFVEADIKNFNSSYKYDLVISSLAIHHLEERDKVYFFENVLNMLNSGGWFFVMDHFEGASKELEEFNNSRWRDLMCRNGLSQSEIEYVANRRAEHDRCESIFKQMVVFKKTGFTSIDVLWKYYGIGIFCARKW